MTTKAKIVLARAEQRNLSWMGAAGSKRWRRKLVNMLIVSATQTFLFFSAVWWTIMHCNGVKCVASCNTMYQNYQDPSLPSGSDILRYVWTCRASAIYDMPINCRYIQKRCPALDFTHNTTLHPNHPLKICGIWPTSVVFDSKSVVFDSNTTS